MVDGRRLDGITISLPCEPNGSGELKRNILTFFLLLIVSFGCCKTCCKLHGHVIVMCNFDYKDILLSEQQIHKGANKHGQQGS